MLCNACWYATVLDVVVVVVVIPGFEDCCVGIAGPEELWECEVVGWWEWAELKLTCWGAEEEDDGDACVVVVECGFLCGCDVS